MVTYQKAHIKNNVNSQTFSADAPHVDNSGDVFSYREMTALYYLKDFNDMISSPLNMASDFAKRLASNPLSLYSYTSTGRHLSAVFELSERATHRYLKPSFGIKHVVTSQGHGYNIFEKIVIKKPFCQLLHFERHPDEAFKGTHKKSHHFPKVLVVAPYSGHYATLLRDTVNALLQDHDVYVTDWENARDVPITRGNFTLDDYMDYLFEFVQHIGPGLNILGVCQPAVPVIAMCAVMAARNDDCQPESMILMGGPIDTRENPTQVNILSKEKPFEWFTDNVIARVPHYYAGAYRRVCPGFLMLAGFMNLNLERHIEANHSLFEHLTHGAEQSAEAHRRFYNEYRSVLDLPADYFLDSVRVAFKTHALPLGKMMWRDQRVDLTKIRDTALLTIEGERDDISGLGQTKAAQALCTNIPDDRKQHHMQQGVGHYGVFNGHRWRESIMPEITKFIQKVAKPHPQSSKPSKKTMKPPLSTI